MQAGAEQRDSTYIKQGRETNSLHKSIHIQLRILPSFFHRSTQHTLLILKVEVQMVGMVLVV